MAESLARCEAGRRYFPTEKLLFKGAAHQSRALSRLMMLIPANRWVHGRGTGYGEETSWCRVPDSRSATPFHFSVGTDTDPGCHHSSDQRPSQPEDAGAVQPSTRLEAKRRAVEALDMIAGQAVQ
jgi:hypothetical protein